MKEQERVESPIGRRASALVRQPGRPTWILPSPNRSRPPRYPSKRTSGQERGELAQHFLQHGLGGTPGPLRLTGTPVEALELV